MARKARKGLCTYCGEWRPGGRDHVPPKALFAATQPLDTITVFCCEECRGPTGKDDEYATGLMALRQEADNPDAAVRRQKFLRGMAKENARGLKASFLGTVREVSRRTPAGLYAGTAALYEADLKRIVRVVERTIRGLWRHHQGDPLSPDATVAAFAEDWLIGLDEAGTMDVANIVVPFQSVEYRAIGDGTTFRYKLQITAEQPDASGWMLEFYESTRFVGLTLPPGYEDRVRSQEGETLPA